MQVGKGAAFEGIIERVRGGEASRVQAGAAAIGAGVLVYRLLRSGSGNEKGKSGDGEREE